MTATFATDRLVAAIETAVRHVRSEATNDVDQIMPTISADVCYLMPDVTTSEAPLVVLTERDRVRDFYSHERTFLEVVSSELLAEVTGDWYSFHETLATTRDVETGALHRNEVAVLFPVADDGIIGEILISRRKWMDVFAGTAVGATGRPDDEVATLRSRGLAAHERFLDALRTADAPGAGQAFSDDARIAVRDVTMSAMAVLSGSGPQAGERRARMVADALDDREVVVLNRIVSDWYVFCDWVVRGVARPGALPGVEGGQAAEIRSASVFSLTADALLGGELGFSMVAPGR